MNIAFIFYCPIVPYVGGVQRVTDVLAKAFVKKGHNVVFICTDIRGKDNSYENFSASQLYLDSSKPESEYIADYLKILSDNNIQIVVSQEARPDSLLLLKNTPNAIKKVSVVHINPYAIVNNERRIKRCLHPKRISTLLAKYLVIAVPQIARKWYVKKEIRFYRQILSVSDKLIFLSKSFVETVMEYDPSIPKQKLAAIGNPNSFVPSKDLHVKENLIICVARLSEAQKKIRDFISIWNNLYGKNPSWRAEIVGDGPDRKYLERYASRLKVQNLKFVGKVENVKDYFQRAKIVCMTSIYEGWGMVLTEGMSCGCVPCVYGSYGAAFDIVDDDDNGIISTPFQPKEMAKRIQQLIDDDVKRQKMSVVAKEKVKQFDAVVVAEKWESLFRSMLNG